MNENIRFECQQCGECCRHLEGIDAFRDIQINGVCQYLVGDLCSIYTGRPDLCRFDEAYELLGQNMTKAEFHRLCVLYCQQLRSLKDQNG